MKILVLGLGNPLLGDDGVGWRVAEEVAKRLAVGDGSPLESLAVEVDWHAGGGLSLMERLVGYDRAIIVDAMNLGRSTPGNVASFTLEELPDAFAGHLASTHDTTLPAALEMGRAMGARLPDDIFLVTIESPHVYDFSEELSRPVSEAVPVAVQSVLERLKA